MTEESPEKRALVALRKLRARVAELEGSRNEAIAVVGLACRFPGADHSDALWSMLNEGRDAITIVPESRWDAEAWFDPDRSRPNKMNTRWGGFLRDAFDFDPGYFQLSPREATRMDPQQRLMLEVAVEALEHAGIPQHEFAGGRAGVFVGVTAVDYLLDAFGHGDVEDPLTLTGNAHSALAGRLAFALDLRGPALAVDTACSSSLVAIHLACQSLRRGESQLALAGGVNLLLAPEISVALSQGGFMAADGRCKTFDARADGYVRSEGCGVVVLKRLSDALSHRDRIWGLLRGSAVNQDGRSSGLTAPNLLAQRDVVNRALDDAGFKAGEISCIEAHGTGTALGDPIEVEALKQAFAGSDTACALGSIKTNLGHLEAAAGVAGLIKVLLALDRESLPPHANFEHLNPEIELVGTPFFIPRASTPWPRSLLVRRAGVSSFSFAGTNAHLIVEEAPARDEAPLPDRGSELFCLSARSAPALRDQARLVAESIHRAPMSLYHLAATAARRRSHHPERAAMLAASTEDLREQLLSLANDAPDFDIDRGSSVRDRAKRPVFVFSGQGGLWPGVPSSLFETEPVYRSAFERAEHAYAACAGDAARPTLRAELESSPDASRLYETSIAQPVLFALQIALAALWRHWGIEPVAVVGHSVGEVAAAHVAGAIDLNDAMRIVVARGRVMESARGQGRMLALPWDEARSRDWVSSHPGTDVAAVNGPNRVVLAGEAVALEDAASCAGARWLDVEYAFHSPHMDSCVASLDHELSGINTRETTLPMVSTLTGKPVSGHELDSAYWARHVRGEVRFADAIFQLRNRGYASFHEIGPHPILHADLLQCLEAAKPDDQSIWLGASMRRGSDPRESSLQALARMHVRGASIAWDHVFPVALPPASLPTYAWQHQSYRSRDLAGGREPKQAFIDWIETTLPAAPESIAAGCWLLWMDSTGVGAALSERLGAAGTRVIEVTAGSIFQSRGIDRFVVRPESREDAARVLASIGEAPATAVHLWSLDSDAPDDDPDAIWDAQSMGCISVLALLQALAEHSSEADLWAVTRGAESVGDLPSPDPPFRGALSQSPLWGFARCAALEAPGIWRGIVDLDPAARASDPADALLRAIAAPPPEDQYAVRGERFFLPRLRPLEPKDPSARGLELHEGSVLVTGGVGAIGFALADWLVGQGVRDLVLTARRPLASPQARDSLDPDSDEARRCARVEALENRGARVRVVAVDVADVSCMAPLLAELAPTLRGVVHAAGISRPCDILELGPEAFRETLVSKVRGAAILHAHTRGLDLDLFLLCSSIASVWGSGQLSHYAAANHFLDSLALTRRAQGLAALSINFGPWSNGGMTDSDSRARLSKIGLAALHPREAIRSLQSLLETSHAQSVIAHIDWDKLHPVLAARRERPLLDEIRTPATIDPTHDTTMVDSWRSLPESARIQALRRHVRDQVAASLGLEDPGQLDPLSGFFELGMDSVVSVELRNRLERQLGISLPATLAFDVPNVEALASRLDSLLFPNRDEGREDARMRPPLCGGAEDGIAVVGMACRFPGGVHDVESFWASLRSGKDALEDVPSERWNVDDWYDPGPDARGKMYTRRGGFLADVQGFDARFFGISPREARSIDPQQRVLLEVACEALEHAGTRLERIRGSRAGVFTGVSANSYAETLRACEEFEGEDAYLISGNVSNMAAGRISHALGLQGPSITLDTACSSSLVAIHLAAQSLRRGESDVALAGGVNLILSPLGTVYACATGMLAPDGRCKPFDARADGYVRSEGCGVVVLKRLQDAKRDGDVIWAVVRGSAVNHDGPSSGLTVPNGNAQEAVILEALHASGLDPADIGYVEAHGTGTALGDPIEIHALDRALGSERSADRRLRVGSLKAQFGHMEAAAGVAGFIKAALVLKHREIPAQVDLREINPNLEIEARPLLLVRTHQDWSESDEPRRAGVSSFGLSGTNAHVILEEAPASRVERRISRGSEIICLSARDEQALRAYAGDLAGGPDLSSLYDVGFTSARRRSHHPYRLAVVADDPARLREVLAKYSAGNAPSRDAYAGASVRNAQGPVFVFSGQGGLSADLPDELWDLSGAFGRTFESAELAFSRCHAGSAPFLLRDALQAGRERSGIDRTSVAQPALFALQISLAALWQSWGIEPEAVVGHSVGEIAAACVAGILDLDDAMQLVTARARQMEGSRGHGRMLAWARSEAEAREVIADVPQIAIAAVNAPRSVVLAGERAALEALASSIGDETRWLEVDYGFHSPQMQDASAALASALGDLRPKAERIPFFSSVTGARLEGSTLDAHYWARHLRETVRFDEATRSLADAGYSCFLEIGPHPVLREDLQQSLENNVAPVWLGGSLRRKQAPRRALLGALASLYVRGLDPDWDTLFSEPARPASLPSYPWSHERHWCETNAPKPRTAAFRGRHPLLQNLARLSDGSCYWNAELDVKGVASLPGQPDGDEEIGQGAVHALFEIVARESINSDPRCDFKRLTPLRLAPGERRHVQVSTETGPEGSVAIRLEARSQGHSWNLLAEAIARPGSRLPSTPNTYGVAWRRSRSLVDAAPEDGSSWWIISDGSLLARDLVKLLEDARADVEVWGTTDAFDAASILERTNPAASPRVVVFATATSEGSVPDRVEAAVGRLAGSVRALLLGGCLPTRTAWITRGATTLAAGSIDLAGSAVWGLGRVLDRENPELHPTRIDFSSEEQPDDALALLRELLNDKATREVALYSEHRWVPRLVQREAPTANPSFAVHRDGRYLITGGTGAVGSAMALALARRGARHLVLASRSAPAADSPVLAEIRAAGAQVEHLAVDVGNREQTFAAIRTLTSAGPPLRGVIHAAGVLHDGILLQLEPSAIREVFASKVSGSWNLHEATRDLELDFFVLCSSIAALLGSPGQGSYAAANAFLDALAHARCAENRPALSVDWGPWDGPGMAFGRDFGSIGPLDPEAAIEAMGAALASGVSQLCVVATDLSLAADSEEGRECELLAELRTREPAAEVVGARLVDRLQDLDAPQQRQGLTRQLRAWVAEALELPVHEISSDWPIADLGFDSLMAVALRRRIENQLGIALPATLLLTYPTLEAVTQELVQRLWGQSGARDPASSGEPSRSAPPVISDLVKHASELTDAQALALMMREHGERNDA